MIRKFYRIAVMGLALCGTPAMSHAQQPLSNATASSGTSGILFPDLETQLMSLDSIMEIAIANSPYLKYDSAMIDINKMDIKLAKREWQKNFSGFVNYSKGNQVFLIQNESMGHQTNLVNGYRYGLNLNIPLTDFTTRRIKIKQSQSEVEAQMYRKEQTELGLRRQVAQEYNNLIAAQKLLKIKSESLENFKVLKQLGERQFREGTISLEDYALVSDMAVKAEADYELSKSNFKTLYEQFENLIGVKLTTLIRRR